jgi:hypothetical protein
MDRTDEKRDERTDERDDSSYNPLGIGNLNPPRDKVRRDDDTVGVEETGSRPGSREIQRSPGATSIDMGAGGTGTEIERD